MCSIFGIMYYKSCSKNILKDVMTKLSTKTIHRGPDENEIQYFENAAIGMNRLSIIGPKEKNVMVQKDKNFYSVFNGEITNYKSLEIEINKNIKCDSEVILPLFKKYNRNFVKKLGGMFAISIYDELDKKLYLYRDPLGVKPLYYYSNNEFFIFASEIKAIYSVINKKPNVNFDAIDNILRYGCNPGRDTAICEIKKVLPRRNDYNLQWKNRERKVLEFKK